MRITTITGLALTLGACISGGGEPPPLAPLAEDAEQPVLALLVHVLTGHFAAFGASRTKRAISASSCSALSGPGSSRAPDQCTGWVAAPGSSAKRYAMGFEDGAWRFTADPRTIAE